MYVIKCNILLDLIRVLLQSSILRYNALVALRKSLTTAKKAVTDGVSKDIIKQMKSALNDKSLPVQRAATDVRSFTLHFCV